MVSFVEVSGFFPRNANIDFRLWPTSTVLDIAADAMAVSAVDEGGCALSKLSIIEMPRRGESGKLSIVVAKSSD